MKKNIIIKASALFSRLGFKSVTMDDLADAMGISKKTLYQHFENKNEIVRECGQFIFDNVCDEIRDIKATASHPIEELYLVKTAVMKHFQNESTSPVYQLQKYYPDVYQMLKDQEYDRLGEMVQSSLKIGIQTRLFRPNINVDFVARLYMNGLRGIRDVDIFPPNNYQIESIFEAFLEYHARAIVTPRGLEILNQYTAKT